MLGCAAATTGLTNLLVSARFRGTRRMYDYITGRVPGLSGIRSMETSLIVGRFKQVGPRRPASEAERHPRWRSHHAWVSAPSMHRQNG